ncbi:MAG: YggT family protein [Chitinophagales bacterium]
MVYSIVNLIFKVMIWLVVARCILSFIKHNPAHPIIRFIYETTEPVMAPFRRLVPMTSGMDFSPILVFFALELLRQLVLALIAVLMKMQF